MSDIAINADAAAELSSFVWALAAVVSVSRQRCADIQIRA
jgi:hypothetical protein